MSTVGGSYGQCVRLRVAIGRYRANDPNRELSKSRRFVSSGGRRAYIGISRIRSIADRIVGDTDGSRRSSVRRFAESPPDRDRRRSGRRPNVYAAPDRKNPLTPPRPWWSNLTESSYGIEEANRFRPTTSTRRCRFHGRAAAVGAANQNQLGGNYGSHLSMPRNNIATKNVIAVNNVSERY